MKQFVIAIFLLQLNISCKKTSEDVEQTNQKTCWKITDAMFNDKGIQCDKTAAEIAALHPDGYYYRTDEPLVCWYESSTGNYRADLPASLKNKYLSPSYTQVPCGFCAFWYFREKRKFVPTGSFTYSPITYQRLCADSVRTLFRGKEVLLRQSTDSVITRQFSDDGINW